MATTLTGTPASVTPAAPSTVTAPVDGDALSAASVNTAFQKLIDIAAILRTGYAADADAQYQTTTEPTAFKLIHKIALPGGKFLRYYSIFAGGEATTINAEWVGTLGAEWEADDAASPAFLYSFEESGGVIYYYKSPAASWASAAWTTTLFELSTSGSLTVENVLSTTTGNIESGADVEAAANVRAQAGYVRANGDPASDQGRVYTRQFIAETAAAPTGTKGVALNNGGVDGALTIAGTDACGSVTAETGAVVSGVSGDAICVVTFNKSYPAAPYVVLSPANAPAADLATQPYVESAAGSFTIRIGTTPLGAGGGPADTYKWNFHVLGG